MKTEAKSGGKGGVGKRKGDGGGIRPQRADRTPISVKIQVFSSPDLSS